MKNKIGWCSMTWNPVWGCLNDCEYCYARGIAKRFALKMVERENYYLDYEDLYEFKPTFLESQFEKKFPKKPQRIFVGSMSEIYYWDEVWIQKVIDKTKQYPQHTFQFLTKHPEVYVNWVFPSNCWLGLTVVNAKDIFRIEYFAKIKNNHIRFISIEPMSEDIPTCYLKGFDWVIIGAETGNRKGKIIPKREWIEDIIDYCKDNNIPVYLKDSLKKIFPSWVQWIKEFPKGGIR